VTVMTFIMLKKKKNIYISHKCCFDVSIHQRILNKMLMVSTKYFKHR